jgi:2-polyprenyl-3-methyl-5-hydroxy-6-metoxy-1,4-benzoquinol methylase
MSRWARATGLNVVDIAGLAYDALQHTARRTGDVSVNYMMHLKRDA